MRGVATLACFGLTACSLLLSDPAREPSEADAGGGLQDSAVTVDAVGQADAASPACPVNTLFCDDFERSGPLLGAWDRTVGLVQISNTESLSPSRSLRPDLARGATLPSLTKSFANFPKKFTFSVALFAGKSRAEGLEIAKISLGQLNNWDTFGLQIDSGGLQGFSNTYDNTGTPTRVTARTLVAAAEFFGTGWHRIDCAVDVSADPRSITMTTLRCSAGICTPMGSARQFAIDSRKPAPDGAELSVGMSYGSNMEAYSDLYFDNVWLRAD
jgi:hypothetical protein